MRVKQIHVKASLLMIVDVDQPHTAQVTSFVDKLRNVADRSETSGERGCSTNVGLMLDQRRRRWANIKPTLVQRLVMSIGLCKQDRIYTDKVMLSRSTTTS